MKIKVFIRNLKIRLDDDSDLESFEHSINRSDSHLKFNIYKDNDFGYILVYSLFL